MSKINQFKKGHTALLNVMGRQVLCLLTTIEQMGYLHEPYSPQISMLSIGIDISDKANPQLHLELDSEIGKQRFDLPIVIRVDETETEREKLEFEFAPIKG